MERQAGAVMKRLLTGTRVLVLLASLLGIVGPGTGWADGKLYWTDDASGKVQRANLDGSMVEDLVTGLQFPGGLALDPVGDRLYWAENAFPARILQADLDGNGAGVAVPNPSDVLALALDLPGGKIYFTSPGHNAIRRANLDGTGVEVLVGEGDVRVLDPAGLALDLVAGKMYWTDGPTGKVQRANLDGTGVEDLVTGVNLLNFPTGLALDLAAGKMYWTDAAAGTIRRANLDGTGVEDLVAGISIRSDFGECIALALDLARGKLYWAELEPSRIRRANLDGTDVEDVLALPGARLVDLKLLPGASLGRRLTALGPATLWAGVTNSDNNGRRIDLRVEVYRNDELIGEGELANRPVGGNALGNSTRFTIPLDLLGEPVEFGEADTLAARVLVRRQGGSGDIPVRFWYGGSEPPPASRKGWSHFEATVDGTSTSLYFRGEACPVAPCVLPLGEEPGTAGVASVQAATAAYQPFGDWTALFTAP
jgi:low density lipoprotein receptor-related protein 5/6